MIKTEDLMNDTGNAERLVKKYGHRLRYCKEFDTPFVWTGSRWQSDGKFRESRLLAKVTIAEAMAALDQIADSTKRDKLFQYMVRSLNLKGLNDTVKLAMDKMQEASIEDFDNNPEILCTRNGVVNLRDGSLNPATPEAMCSKLIPFDYDPYATCPKFLT